MNSGRFDEWLLGFMEMHGLDVADIARLAGVTPNTVYQWKRGNGPLHPEHVQTSLEAAIRREAGDERALAVHGPEVTYAHARQIKEITDRLRRAPDLVGWILGLLTILESGDHTLVDGIQKNITGFLRALGKPEGGVRRREARRKTG